MKKLFIFSFLFFLGFQSVIAQLNDIQSDDKTIVVERRTVMLEDRYFILGQPVPRRDVIKLMKPYKEAQKEMKASRRWRISSAVTAGLGLSIIAGELISAQSKEGFSLPVVGIGAGVFLLAVPLSIKSDRKANSAIDKYNLRQAGLGSNNERLKLGLALDDRGVGLKLKF